MHTILKKQGASKNFRTLFILWGLTAVSCLIIFSPFLFGEHLVVFNDAGSDTRQQYLMQYATIVNHIRNGNFSFWDLNNGFGTSMLALNLFNPFLMLIYAAGVILGCGHISGVLVFILILEIFLAGTCCYFLLNCFSFSEGSKLIASYIYGLNGYLLVWGQHYQFGAFVVFLPLLLFLLERAIRQKRFSLTAPLLVAVMVCSSVYMSYMSLLLAGCYLLYRMIVQEKGSRRERIFQFFRHCGSMLLGIGIGLAVFLPMAYYLLTISSRLDSEVSLLQRFLDYLSLYSPKFYITAFLRFFSTAFQGIGDYNGYSNFYEAPVLFFTSLFVITAFQYVFTIRRQACSKKKKLMQYLAVLFFFFCLFIRAGASVFNAFAYPFSRHSFLFMPLFALLMAFTLDQLWKKRIFSPLGFLLSTAAILAGHGYVLTHHEITEPVLRTHTVLMFLLALILTVLVLASCLTKAGSRRRHTIPALLLLTTAVSICLEGNVCYNERDTLTTSDASYWGGLYNPNVASALQYLKETDGTLYRVEKDYYSGSLCMDSLAQDYRGISSYNSTPNRNIEEFIQKVTPNLPIMAEHEYTWRQIGYYTGHSTLFGIKYLLSQNSNLKLQGYTLLKQFGDIYVYQNEHVSSLARFYTKAGDAAVLDNDTQSPLDLERLLQETILLDSTQAFSLQTENTSPEDLHTEYALELIPSDIQKQKGTGDTDSITIPLNRRLLDTYERVYLEFDITAKETSDITVNQEQPLEYHFRVQKGKTKHVQIAIPKSYENITLTRYGGNLQGTVKNIRFLGSKAKVDACSDAEITLADTKKDSRITGSLTALKSGYLFLPIPYENGWKAYIDGKEVEILRSDLGFVSVPVMKGSHDFTFVYEVPFQKAGLIGSCASLILWGILLGLRYRRKAKTNRR